MGYFSLETLAQIIHQQACFLSQWLIGGGLREPTEQTNFDLLAYLQNSPQDTLELHLWVGFQKKIPCRLLAIRLPAEAVQEKRRKLHATARKKGRTVSATSLAWAAWAIFVTTCQPNGCRSNKSPCFIGCAGKSNCYSKALAQALHDPRRLEDCRTRLVTVWQQCGMKDQRRTRLSTCQQIARAGGP